MLNPEATAVDEDLEFEIDCAWLHLTMAQTPKERSMWWSTMKTLIARRSPEHVEEMERARGLR